MSSLFGWFCLVMVLAGLGIVAGVFLDRWWTEQRQKTLSCNEAKLQAEWDALHAAQRMNVAFMQSRQTMYEEAIRQFPRPVQ